jgi:hypothetical protein
MCLLLSEGFLFSLLRLIDTFPCVYGVYGSYRRQIRRLSQQRITSIRNGFPCAVAVLDPAIAVAYLSACPSKLKFKTSLTIEVTFM